MRSMVASYRKLCNLTQSEVSRALGISSNTYSNKEIGKTEFTRKEMIAFYNLIKSYIPDITISAIFFENQLQNYSSGEVM